ncbi:MAG: hypothetical protein WC613_01880 [Candidatus Aenigmatarchaeota archaeon]
MKKVKNFFGAKKSFIVVVVVILLVVAGYYILAPAECALGKERVYAGQPVDNEQALAKLTAFIGGLNRTQFPAGLFSSMPEISSLVLKETNVTRVKNMKVLLDKQATEISGFVMDVPYKDGDRLVYGDGYFLSEGDGYLYKMNRADCKS